MRPLAALTTTTAALAALSLIPGSTAVAKTKTKCKAKHEASGCVLKNARYSSRTNSANFGVSAGKGEASAAGTVTCTSSDGNTSGPTNVLYGSYPDLAIKNPKIGQSYTRKLHLDQAANAATKSVSDITLVVKLTSASSAHISYTNSTVQTTITQQGATITNTCKGTVSVTVKRAA